VDNGVVDECVEVALFRRNSIIAVKDQITDDGQLGGIAAVVAARDCGRTVRRRTVSMHMHKDVAFDPSVRSIEVQTVVLRAAEHIIDKMHDWTRPVPAGEIDDIVVANYAPKKFREKNSVSAQSS
jgi:hypothetical protein